MFATQITIEQLLELLLIATTHKHKDFSLKALCIMHDHESLSWHLLWGFYA